MRTSFPRRRTGPKTKFAETPQKLLTLDGRRVLYRGRYHKLQFVRSSSQRIRVHDKTIVLPDYANINLKQVLKDWMRKETEKLVEKRLEQFSRKLKLTTNGFSVRDTKKWAYHTRVKGIVFNSQLMALAGELADFVILRELIRLKEFAQPKDFRPALASIVPDFRERELSLKGYTTE